MEQIDEELWTLTKQIAMAVIAGIPKQTVASVRQGINVFRKNVVKIPIVWQIIVYPIKTLRVDGSLE